MRAVVHAGVCLAPLFCSFAALDGYRGALLRP
jgi:hypothetical protein